MNASSLLNAVHELAAIGAAEAMRSFGRSGSVEIKSDGSPVTEADRRAEQRMREWIASRFPRDGIVGEELGEVNGGERAPGGQCWVLDPIDGTRSFARGVPMWGTLVAVVRGGQAVAGAIHCPALSEAVHAAIGEGCWRGGGGRARVSDVGDLPGAAWVSSDCYGYLLVATGRADVSIDPEMSLWDAAALQPVIEEAGGVFTDWSGRATIRGGSAIATNAALATAARELIRGGR